MNINIKTHLSEPELVWMKKRWLSLSEKLHIDRPNAIRLFKIIISHYGEKHRAYHNLSHIYTMLGIIDQHKSGIEDFSAVEIAVWFHDIIYKAPGKLNELKSAALASDYLAPYCSERDIKRIKHLIISTKNHLPVFQRKENFLLLDADLAVLAADRCQYAFYRNAIRKEYSGVPNLLFNRGRKKVLSSFLKRKNIYYTERFKSDYEDRARENLKWELDHT